MACKPRESALACARHTPRAGSVSRTPCSPEPTLLPSAQSAAARPSGCSSAAELLPPRRHKTSRPRAGAQQPTPPRRALQRRDLSEPPPAGTAWRSRAGEPPRARSRRAVDREPASTRLTQLPPAQRSAQQQQQQHLRSRGSSLGTCGAGAAAAAQQQQELQAATQQQLQARGTTFASAREPRPWCCASRGWTAPRWRARRSRPSAAAEWPLELESAPGAAEPDDSRDDSPRRAGLEGLVSRTLQVAAALVQQEQAAREARKAAEEARLLVFVASSKGRWRRAGLA